MTKPPSPLPGRTSLDAQGIPECLASEQDYGSAIALMGYRATLYYSNPVPRGASARLPSKRPLPSL
jgi:hypothetical protein